MLVYSFMKAKTDQPEVPIPTSAEPLSFGRLARQGARWAGHPFAFGVAAGGILVWGLSGPLFQFSDTWQLVINTTTTIITFLMVFLIQNSQNRDSEAVQLKLDELIRATKAAHNVLLGIEELNEDELERLKAHYQELAKRARSADAPTQPPPK
jgi:low affinity Fe/Cu permease